MARIVASPHAIVARPAATWRASPGVPDHTMTTVAAVTASPTAEAARR